MRETRGLAAEMRDPFWFEDPKRNAPIKRLGGITRWDWEQKEMQARYPDFVLNVRQAKEDDLIWCRLKESPKGGWIRTYEWYLTNTIFAPEKRECFNTAIVFWEGILCSDTGSKVYIQAWYPPSFPYRPPKIFVVEPKLDYNTNVEVEWWKPGMEIKDPDGGAIDIFNPKIVNDKLTLKIPHMYEDSSLCLIHTQQEIWANKHLSICVADLIDEARLWLTAFDIWRTQGFWPTGELEGHYAPMSEYWWRQYE